MKPTTVLIWAGCFGGAWLSWFLATQAASIPPGLGALFIIAATPVMVRALQRTGQS